MFDANVVVIVAGVTGESANVTSYLVIVNADAGHDEVTMFRKRNCMPVIRLPGGTLAICAAEYTACDVPPTAFPIPDTLPIVPAVVSDAVGTKTTLCPCAVPPNKPAQRTDDHPMRCWKRQNMQVLRNSPRSSRLSPVYLFGPRRPTKKSTNLQRSAAALWFTHTP